MMQRRKVQRAFTGLVGRKPGRPKLYATEEERKAAHAESKRKKRTAKRKRRERQRERRELRRLLQGAVFATSPQGCSLRDELRFAIENGWSDEEIEALENRIEAIEGRPVNAKEMEEYDQQIARQKGRDERANAVTLDDLRRGAGLRNGMYVTDAPQDEGLISFSPDVARISDAQQLQEEIGGRRVTPEGFGILDHKEGDAPHETEEQWMNKHFRWNSTLKCYRPECRNLVVGILPEDIDKPRDKCRYHCDLHRPIGELNGHRNVSAS